MVTGTRGKQGLIIVFTGNGKGKTTAALGLALRAAGQQLRVLILQFMKGLTAIGEMKALSEASLPITVRRFGRPGFVQNRVCEALDQHIAFQGIEAVQEAMANQAYDMIVLDEINMAVDFGLLQIEDVMEIIEKKPPELHLVLTGRNAKKELLEIADLVTEMREVKHPYNQGIKAQKGIEF
ncbi:MAG: cob(I)yrinic acid a,c-diamide adenosyltransferase [Desulfobacteraceae bacterium]|nr:MAG: cob(I)yrinic acid a,c-diamide adenosyltransferase [Desulfobacteraceae bacterium]